MTELDLDEIRGEGITMVITKAEDYLDLNTDILGELTKESQPGVYVTVNKPYSGIVEILDESGVNTDNILFVDAISKETGRGEEDEENVLYMDSPEDLTGLSIVIQEAVESMGDTDKFVFLDSLTTLTIYNETDTVSKFGHYLTGKMRSWDGVEGVIVSLAKEEVEDELIDQMSQFCDNVVRLVDE